MLRTDINWEEIVGYIRAKKLTPVISNQLVNKAILGGEHVATWAGEIGYPLGDTDNLTRVAQFLCVTKTPGGAKLEYLQFLKRRLLELARADFEAGQEHLDPTDRDSKAGQHLDRTERELARLSFSELATERLNYPDFVKDKDHPLWILATMDIPIYLTTSHHSFMEAALHQAGKHEFRSQVYCWSQHVKDEVPEKCRPDLSFVPDDKRPLIYHLHGLDAYPDSLVLTENDYLEFLASFVADFRDQDVTPSKVRTSVTSSFLLLLGYELHAWDLRVLWQAIPKGPERRHPGVAIQLDPRETGNIENVEAFQQYLQEYFGEAKIGVCWGTAEEFMVTLQDKLQGR